MNCKLVITKIGEGVVNTFEYQGEGAYKQLSILLLNRLNKGAKVVIMSEIIIEGIHQIVATMKVGGTHIYDYAFTGEDVEGLPRVEF